MNFRKSIWIAVISSIVIFGILVFIGDSNLVYQSLNQFSWEFLPLALGFFLVGLFVRILRWHYWFRKIEKKIPFTKSAIYYMSGLAFIMTPGRFGEAARSYFIKEETGIAKSKTVPLVLLERFFDLIGLILMISIGLVFLDFDKIILILPLALIAILTFITQKKNLMIKILRLPQKIKFLSKVAPNAEDSVEIVSQTVQIKSFIMSSLLGLFIVFLDISGAFMLIQGFEIDLSYIQSSFIISGSVIIGALSFVPGGLGVIEGGLVGFMSLEGIENSKVVSFSILYRITYSWFLTIIGIFFMHYVSKNLNKDKIT